MANLVLVRTFPNHALARIAADQLAAHDIIAHVEGAGSIGALGVEAVSIRVLVASDDLVRARAALDAEDGAAIVDERELAVASAAAATSAIESPRNEPWTVSGRALSLVKTPSGWVAPAPSP